MIRSGGSFIIIAIKILISSKSGPCKFTRLLEVGAQTQGPRLKGVLWQPRGALVRVIGGGNFIKLLRGSPFKTKQETGRLEQSTAEEKRDKQKEETSLPPDQLDRPKAEAYDLRKGRKGPCLKKAA